MEATSDGDVVLHALIDALLGAASLGDLGMHFPSSDPRWHGADSVDLLAHVVDLVDREAWRVIHADMTVLAQHVAIAPHREAMRNRIAGVLGIAVERVSVKATSTDGLGFVGAGEGLAAMATVTVATAGE